MGLWYSPPRRTTKYNWPKPELSPCIRAPLTWENGDNTSYGREHSHSPTKANSSTYSASVTAKGDLPPLPSPGASRFEQSTVRHAPLPAEKSPVTEQHADAYEDYDDQFVDTYSSVKGGIIQQKMQDMHLDDDLPDTTMLDSVVLPAIASVSGSAVDEYGVLIFLLSSCSRGCRRKRLGWPSAPCNEHLQKPKESSQE